MTDETEIAPPSSDFEVLNFIVGFLLPIVVFGLLAKANSMNSSNASESYRSNYQVALYSEDNATFEMKLNPTNEHPTLYEIRIGSSYNYHFLPGGDHSLEVGKGLGGWSDYDSTLAITQVEYGSSAEPVEIGYYNPSNQTVYFQLDNVSHEELTLWLYYTSDGSSGSKFSGTVSQLIPLVAVASCIGLFYLIGRTSHTPFGRGLIYSLIISMGAILVLMMVFNSLDNLFYA
jgi:hypothetical protein